MLSVCEHLKLCLEDSRRISGLPLEKEPWEVSGQRSLSTMATKTTPGKRLLDPLSCRPRMDFVNKGRVSLRKEVYYRRELKEKGSTLCSFRRGGLLERAATEGLL